MDIWQSALESEEGRGFVLKRREGRTREINREGDREEWEGGDARERNALGGGRTVERRVALCRYLETRCTVNA